LSTICHIKGKNGERNQGVNWCNRCHNGKNRHDRDIPKNNRILERFKEIQKKKVKVTPKSKDKICEGNKQEALEGGHI